MKKERIYRLLNVSAAVILLAVVLAAVLPVFVCDQFRIGGVSMEPVLHSGDHILVNKLLMGARIYTGYDFSDPELECIRMPGLRKIRPGDVAVFNYPYGYDRKRIEFRINYVYAKRCIGCPGDTVRVVDGFYRNARIPDVVLGSESSQAMLRETSDDRLKDMGVYMDAMPYSPEYGWTIRNFGPFYVPCEGSRVLLDSSSVKLYGKAIEYETGYRPAVSSGKVYIGDTAVHEYVFKGNWYFFGGDNVLNSKDSRYIGLVPEEYIVGVAPVVLFSRNPYTGKMDWSRFMKRI